jgi:catechol 2,3-dioxygenase-like lactoylglutathione lyase family enzyme
MKFNEFITFFGCKDLKETSNFYQNILGLTLYKDQKICLIFNINKHSKIGFCKHIPVIHTEKSPIITLVTDDVDEIYTILINKGLKISESPKLNEKFKIYHFFFEDPNGYTIEIQRFLED